MCLGVDISCIRLIVAVKGSASTCCVGGEIDLQFRRTNEPIGLRPLTFSEFPPIIPDNFSGPLLSLEHKG
jgi:hypothetical protein